MSTPVEAKLPPTLWLLRCVLPGRYGRWVTAFVVFLVGLVVFWFGGILSADPREIAPEVKSVALFFCVITAYVVSTLHYVSERTAAAIDALEPELRAVEIAADSQGAPLREQVMRRGLLWQLGNLLAGITLWLIQSWFLAGGFVGMMSSLTDSTEGALMALGALPPWIVTTVTTHALINNAQLFRRLARVVPVDVLHTQGLMAFGRMAVSGVLVIVGVQASFSIMFFGGVDSVWAWGPGFLMSTSAIGYLLLGPVTPLHARLRAAKLHALAEVDQAIGGAERLQNLTDATNRTQLSELLVVREELRRVPEWPFDMDLLARLGIYLVIVPLTWVGAALIENVVNLVLD